MQNTIEEWQLTLDIWHDIINWPGWGELVDVPDWLKFLMNPELGSSGGSAGNLSSRENMQKGGMAGSVPGTGSGDIIPAMLEPGEFVWPKRNG